MNTSLIYILVLIIVLLIIAIFVYFTRKNKGGRKLSLLAGIAFIFVLFGVFFQDDRIVGYSLLAAGILFAIMDIVRKIKMNKVI